MLVKKISLVIPVFNESESLEILYREILKVFKVHFKKYNLEIIFINDSSEDKTGLILNRLRTKDQRINLITFRKRMGKTQALRVGFQKAGGELVVTLDSDLQDDSNNIPKLLEKLEEGFDLVVGWRKHRKDPAAKIFISKAFNFLLRSISQMPVHDFNCGLKIMRKDVAKKIIFFGQSHRFIPLIAAKAGFKVGEVEVNHRQRLYGKSKYDWTKIFNSFFDFLKIQMSR